MSFETVRYTPERRARLVALLARVGTTQLSDEEFAWWFDRNPAGEGIVSLAVDEGEVVGVAAMSFFRTALDGDETRLAIPVNVATDPRYRGQGVFSTLEQENEARGRGDGLAAHGHLPERRLLPDLRPPGSAGSTCRGCGCGRVRCARRRRPLRARPPGRARRAARAGAWRRRAIHGLEVRPSSASAPTSTRSARARAPATGATSSATPSTSTGATSTRRATTAVSVRTGTGSCRRRGRGHTFKHGVSAGFLADLVAAPEASGVVRALLARAVDEVQGGADALVLLPPPVARRAPRAPRLRLRADEQAAPLHRQAAPRGRALDEAQARPGTSPSATSTSSDAEGRLRHAAGRSAPSRARGDRAEDRGARRARRRGRRARGRRGRGRPAGELPRADVPRTQKAGAARASRPRSRASCAACAAAPSSRTCARSTPSSPRRSCGRSASRSSSGSRTGGRAGSCRRPSAPRPR